MASNWKGPILIDHTQLTAAATTQAIDLFKTAQGNGRQTYVSDVKLQRITDFSGGSVSALTVQVGKSGATDKYLAASDAFTGAKATSETAFGGGAKTGAEDAAVTLQALFTATGDNVVNLTAGKLALYVRLEQIPRL